MKKKSKIHCHSTILSKMAKTQKVGLHRISASALGNPKSAILPKFGSGQISGRIWQTPMQLQCVQLITDKN